MRGESVSPRDTFSRFVQSNFDALNLVLYSTSGVFPSSLDDSSRVVSRRKGKKAMVGGGREKRAKSGKFWVGLRQKIAVLFGLLS